MIMLDNVDQDTASTIREVFWRDRYLAALATTIGVDDPNRFLELIAEGLGTRRTRLSARAAGRAFTEEERGTLAEAGIDVTAPPAGAAESTAGRLARTLAAALTVHEAADRLSVDASRVRQRIAESSLHGIKVLGEWRLPEWQFEGGASIPNLGDVLRRLPVDQLHPLALERWFTTPLEELTLSGEPLSPREWLITGGPSRPLVELAEGLSASF